ncbi:MAG: hypothetical protein ACPG5W_06515, partial [Flavobacteriales bacterium]
MISWCAFFFFERHLLCQIAAQIVNHCHQNPTFHKLKIEYNFAAKCWFQEFILVRIDILVGQTKAAMKLISFNVNGIRAAAKKGLL